MEEKCDALVLRAIDYKDNDKLLTLFAARKGKLTAVCRGVRKGSAKLKFAAQPFCFAEYVLAERSGRYTVTSAFSHDGFYALREDVGKFYAASALLETCNLLLPDGLPADELLFDALKGLSAMRDGAEDEALLRFLLSAAEHAGYAVTADRCPDCGKPVSLTPYFDFDRGCFCCAECPTQVRASQSTYLAVRFCLGEGEKPSDECLKDGVKRALRLMKEYFSAKTEIKSECLSEYIRMI